MNAIIKKRLSFRYGYYTKNIGSPALIVLAFFQAAYSNISTSSVLFTEAEKKYHSTCVLNSIYISLH